MNGFDVWDRNGYDMHGLPTENKVQKKFELQTKKDIHAFGIEKFIKECIKFSLENAELMNQDLWKMGVWMNHEQAYMPIHNSFIEGEWFLIKKVHEKNRLYTGNKVMTWCKSCETSLSKHELEYKTVEDNSIFVKFKVNDKDDEYLIIWTTTPWTIPFNLAVMVNPELDYLKAKVLVDEKTGKYETWIVSSALSIAFISGVAGKSFEIIEEFKGDNLLGLSYTHPFHDEVSEYAKLKKKHKNVHTVILSTEYVDTSAGTGLVHCAPGCGPEDFEVGRAHDIPPFNNIDELGVFPSEMKRFTGMIAKDNDNLFIDVLREKNALIETTYVEHEYAHCWRCKNPIVFRLTEQWFFKTEDLRDKMLDANKDVHWVPDSGKNAFDSWLKNLKDNGITRQRFWGTPVPIWVCDNKKCNKYEVIGSAAELKEKAITAIPDNLHKPWIDTVKLKCSCGHEMSRIPDVLDVWIDAGTVSWNCLDYPKNTELFDKYFPADFILEAKEQIRGWFNLLMVASILAFDKPSFKNVYMTGMLTDWEGEKMSKSLGNVISPYEIIDKYGVDTLRYYISGMTAGEDANFSWDEVALKYKNLIILWNLHNFLIDYKNNNDVTLVNDVKSLKLDAEEKYILSRLNTTIQQVTELLDSYKIDQVPALIESLYLDLSRIYIQLIREKSVIGSDKEKEAILYTIYTVIMDTVKMFSLFCPFITEQIYLDFKDVKDFNLNKESVHDFDWPKHDESLTNHNIETDMQLVQGIMQAMLSCRDKLNMGVRWPLAECIIDTDDASVSKAVESLKDLIIQQVNVKNIVLKNVDVDLKVKPNYKNLGKDFGNMTSKVVEIINTNAIEIAKHIKDNKAFSMDGFEITSNHVVIERVCPDKYVMADFGKGAVYLDKKVTKELELEGYSREVMRRIQQLRKDSQLSKRDVIALSIISDLDFSSFDNVLKEKVGAKTVMYNNNGSNNTDITKYEFNSDETIKGHKFSIRFNKI
jgi:isoleucyl-tRNA synthetase